MSARREPEPGRRSLRVLMLTPDEDQLDRRIVQEAASLARHGVTVDIYPALDPKLGYEEPLPDGVRVLPSPLPVARPRPYRRLLRATKLRIERSIPPLGRLIETVRYRTSDRAGSIAAANLQHLVSLPRYDVVFAHDVPVMPLALELRARWSCRVICDLHEVYPEQREHFTSDAAVRYWRSVEAAGLAAADGIICVNDAVADYVRTTHAPTAEIVVVLNSVPYVDRAELRGASLTEYYPIPAGAKVLLYAGTLKADANLPALIRGFARARLDGWVLALLGRGHLERELRERIEREGAGDRIFIGRRASQHDLVRVIASADAGLIPYRAIGFNYLIATPNKLFEYMQARVPIAASRLPMIERILGANSNGGFVDFSTPETVAEGLKRFVTRTLPAIDDDALERAAKQFSWENDEAALFAVVDAAMRRTAR